MSVSAVYQAITSQNSEDGALQLLLSTAIAAHGIVTIRDHSLQTVNWPIGKDRWAKPTTFGPSCPAPQLTSFVA